MSYNLFWLQCVDASEDERNIFKQRLNKETNKVDFFISGESSSGSKNDETN